MIDLHSHVLPGVDDGALDLEESLAIARSAAADGCQVLVATPHLRHSLFWNHEVAPLRRKFDDLRQRLEGTLDLRFGGEITVRHDSLDEILQLPGGELPTLAGSRYVLLELEPAPIVGPDPLEVVHEVRVAGLFPVLAHPERIPWLAEQPEALRSLVEAGAHLQLTAASVTGGFGHRVQRLCRQLIRAGLVTFVASDAHDVSRRPPGLMAASDAISRDFGKEVANLLVRSHPQAVLEDRPIPISSV